MAMVGKRIDSEPQTLKEYFVARKEFYIPSYQRPYAWQVWHCEKLIEDIAHHMEDMKDSDPTLQDNYFFGAVLIAQESGEQHEVALIDGQQRTTTFMLLLKACLLRIKEELAELSENSVTIERLREKLLDLKKSIIRMLYRLNDDNAFLYRKDDYVLSMADVKYVNDSISELHQSDLYVILQGESFEAIRSNVIDIKGRRLDNRLTNFFKNFRYFYKELSQLNNSNLADFIDHCINHCQVIAITSYDTNQAINIFNSLNGTGLPLTPIEVIVSQTTAKAKDKKDFGERWRAVVEQTDKSPLNLHTLMTHYIFTKLAQQQVVTRNPGVSAFFKKNHHLLRDNLTFTSDLTKLLDHVDAFQETALGQLLDKFNGNFKPFVSSYQFYRSDDRFISYLVRLAALLSLSESPYSSGKFKGFLEGLNLKYSQVDVYSVDDLIAEIQAHIKREFDASEIEETLQESGVAHSLIYLNEYLFSIEKGQMFSLSHAVDIEHIMSKSGQNRENIMQDAGFVTPEEFEEYAEKLGNKILLEASINRSIGDSWFRTKKMQTISNKEGYQGSSYALARSLTDYPKDTWTKEDIDRATQKAAKRITDFIFER